MLCFKTNLLTNYLSSTGTSSLYLVWQKPEQPNGILVGYQIKYVRVSISINGTMFYSNPWNYQLRIFQLTSTLGRGDAANGE